MTHVDLFSGIGGFALAARWAGFTTLCFVEIDEYCRKVLAKNFPGVPILGDIYKLTGEEICRAAMEGFARDADKERLQPTAHTANRATPNGCLTGESAIDLNIGKQAANGVAGQKTASSSTMAGNAFAAGNKHGSFYASITNSTTGTGNADSTILRPGNLLSAGDYPRSIKSSATTATTPNPFTATVLTAGVPCQPASQIGKQKGSRDDRWLWPQAIRILRELSPTWAIFENVPGILALERGLEFERLLFEMEEAGYSVWTFIIPACAVDARHRRDRVWIVGHAVRSGGQQESRGAHGDEAENEGWAALHRDELTGAGEDVANAERRRCEQYLAREIGRVSEPGPCSWPSESKWFAQSGMGGMAVRLPQGLDGYRYEPEWEGVPRVATGVKNRVQRLKGLGNSIQPQVAYEILRVIAETEWKSKSE